LYVAAHYPIYPIGVDLDLVAEVLSQSLKEMNYQAHQFRVTKLMREISMGLTIAENPYIRSFKDRIAYANEVRRLLRDEARLRWLLARYDHSALRSENGGLASMQSCLLMRLVRMSGPKKHPSYIKRTLSANSNVLRRSHFFVAFMVDSLFLCPRTRHKRRD